MSDKQKLIELGKTDKYVFHGSGKDMESLEPRQAFNYMNGVQEKDGEPAVFASQSTDYAIFMAIINKNNCPKGFRAGASTSSKKDSYKITFSATRETLDQLSSESSGWVYVFDRSLFKQIKPTEWASYKVVVPIEKIKVSMQDMPSDIKIIE